MNIALLIIGWMAWAFSAYLALSFAYGCRKTVRSKSFYYPLLLPTAVQTLFWWVIAIVFLFTPFNKLHILWLLPVLFFGAQFLVHSRILILTPVILFLTRIFMTLVLFGTSTSKK